MSSAHHRGDAHRDNHFEEREAAAGLMAVGRPPRVEGSARRGVALVGPLTMPCPAGGSPVKAGVPPGANPRNARSSGSPCPPAGPKAARPASRSGPTPGAGRRRRRPRRCTRSALPSFQTTVRWTSRTLCGFGRGAGCICVWARVANGPSACSPPAPVAPEEARQAGPRAPLSGASCDRPEQLEPARLDRAPPTHRRAPPSSAASPGRPRSRRDG